MPLVLAIQPDRRQAAQLTALVRQQVHAELVLADTTEGALDAIGNRVPDLVLVPALLSPQDDAALAAALRVIAAAAHVRTLTIPVLANGTAREESGGMLAKWRRKSAASPEPDGCDPSLFAEQISAYLQEAEAERAELEDEFVQNAPIVVATPAPIPPPFVIETSELRPPVEPIAAIEPAWVETTASWTEASEMWAAAPAVPEDEPGEEPLIDLSEELADLAPEDPADEEGELFDGERVGVYTIAADPDDPPLESFDLLSAILEPAAPPAAASVVRSYDEAATPIARIAAAPIDTDAVSFIEPPAAIVVAPPAVIFVEPRALTFVERPAANAIEAPEPPRADIEPWVPMFLTPGRLWPTLEGVPAEMPTARAEQPDWIELVASLRQDLERRRTEPASGAADPFAVRPSDGGSAEAHPLAKKPRVHAKPAKPIQDEWGFFDPEQCGFSTLLAKLEEITDEAP